jgi:hypothetical protein
LLRSTAGEGIDQIGQLKGRWDKFELMMESHELMVKEQVQCACFEYFCGTLNIESRSSWLYACCEKLLM